MDFVFDMDGTIVYNHKNIDPAVIPALERCKALEHRVIFASARPIRDLLPVLPEAYKKGTLVGGNGTFTSVNGELGSVGFPAETAEKMYAFAREWGLGYLADGEWNYVYTGDRSHPVWPNIDRDKLAEEVTLDTLGKLVKFVLFTAEQHIIDEMDFGDVTMHIHRDTKMVDICPAGVNKFTGVQRVGVQDGEFIAFGNDINDIALFRHTKEARCVVPDYSCEHYGVTAVLQKDVPAEIVKLAVKYAAVPV